MQKRNGMLSRVKLHRVIVILFAYKKPRGNI